MEATSQGPSHILLLGDKPISQTQGEGELRLSLSRFGSFKKYTVAHPLPNLSKPGLLRHHIKVGRSMKEKEKKLYPFYEKTTLKLEGGGKQKSPIFRIQPHEISNSRRDRPA